MTALNRLSGLLRGSLKAAERLCPHSDDLDPVIAGLEKHNRAGAGSNVSEDLLQVAVRKFWDNQRLETFRDARLVSFGMCVPSRPSGPCIMEDRQRFLAVLDSKTGVDQWADEPRWYRRCYQGLVRSYFTYDAKVEDAPAVGKRNWGDLRDHLTASTCKIGDKNDDPDWVKTVRDNLQLFGNEPCAPYAADVLSGDTAKIDDICKQLGVVKSSWFLRELVLAQVRQAIKENDKRFKEYVPQLIEILNNNSVLRDRGLILILDRYVLMAHPSINELLQNTSVEWWGNPWLPSNKARWGGVAAPARKMVSGWLKQWLIKEFFTKLAEDGVGDRRRANFWLRYVNLIENSMQFALGAKALYSTDRDFEVLRKNMTGLYTELKGAGSSNNAFIMTLGDLVVVEFGDIGALYGYDKSKELLFDTTFPVSSAVDAWNSLRHSSRMLWMKHQDGIKGWNKWEDMFEATLKEHFDISPDAAAKRVTSRFAGTESNPAPALVSAPEQRSLLDGDKRDFSMVNLNFYAGIHGIEVDDRRKLNGNLWIRTDDRDLLVRKTLLDWGFQYKPGKGWWR